MATSPEVLGGTASVTKESIWSSLPSADVAARTQPFADRITPPEGLRGDHARSMPTKRTDQDAVASGSERSTTESYEPYGFSS